LPTLAVLLFLVYPESPLIPSFLASLVPVFFLLKIADADGFKFSSSSGAGVSSMSMH